MLQQIKILKIWIKSAQHQDFLLKAILKQFLKNPNPKNLSQVSFKTINLNKIKKPKKKNLKIKA